MDGNQQPQIMINADNLVGILIHECNKLAAHLGATNWTNINWANVDAHIQLMRERAHQAHALTDVARQQLQAAQPPSDQE